MSCRRWPYGGLTPLDLALVVPWVACHPPWWFSRWACHFLHEATRVFQPYCVITGWAGLPWPGSHPTLTIVVYTMFFRTCTFFFVLGIAHFCKVWTKMNQCYLQLFLRHTPFSFWAQLVFLWSQIQNKTDCYTSFFIYVPLPLRMVTRPTMSALC